MQAALLVSTGTVKGLIVVAYHAKQALLMLTAKLIFSTLVQPAQRVTTARRVPRFACNVQLVLSLVLQRQAVTVAVPVLIALQAQVAAQPAGLVLIALIPQVAAHYARPGLSLRIPMLSPPQSAQLARLASIALRVLPSVQPARLVRTVLRRLAAAHFVLPVNTL
jgi:hypothetical protein